MEEHTPSQPGLATDHARGQSSHKAESSAEKHFNVFLKSASVYLSQIKNTVLRKWKEEPFYFLKGENWTKIRSWLTKGLAARNHGTLIIEKIADDSSHPEEDIDDKMPSPLMEPDDEEASSSQSDEDMPALIEPDGEASSDEDLEGMQSLREQIQPDKDLLVGRTVGAFQTGWLITNNNDYF